MGLTRWLHRLSRRINYGGSTNLCYRNLRVRVKQDFSRYFLLYVLQKFYCTKQVVLFTGLQVMVKRTNIPGISSTNRPPRPRGRGGGWRGRQFYYGYMPRPRTMGVRPGGYRYSCWSSMTITNQSFGLYASTNELLVVTMASPLMIINSYIFFYLYVSFLGDRVRVIGTVHIDSVKPRKNIYLEKKATRDKKRNIIEKRKSRKSLTGSCFMAFDVNLLTYHIYVSVLCVLHKYVCKVWNTIVCLHIF